LSFKSGDPKGSLDGNGNDEHLGSFTISGKFSDKAPYAVEFTFTLSNGAMEFSGWRESDKGGVFGTWKGVNGSGTFAFSPAKESSELVKKYEENAKNSKKEELLAMGFEDWLIDQALQESSTGSLEDAINWITQQLDSQSISISQGSHGTQGNGGGDEEQLSELVAMGFDIEMARDALKKTGNVQAAANWLFDRM